MDCCKCEEHNWDDPQEVVYTDPDGKGYCLFHAPAEHKGIPVEEFNRMFFERIQHTVDLEDGDAICILSGAVFPGAVDFSEYKFPTILFSKAWFEGSVFFQGAIFSGETYFEGVHFKMHSRFNRARFEGGAIFNNAVFENGASFEEVDFKQSGCFQNAVFKETAHFDISSFRRAAVFEGAKFERQAQFRNARWDELANFKHSKFLRTAFFNTAKFQKVADFNNANFKEKAEFNKGCFIGASEFVETDFLRGADFSTAILKGDADFSSAKFRGKALFNSAQFGGKASFFFAEFGGATSFERAIFRHYASFRFVEFGEGASFRLFTATSNAVLVFAECTISRAVVTFHDCDPTCLNLTEQYDLAHFRFINSPWEKNGRIKACTEDAPGRLQTTRDFYQRMKVKYKAENNEYDASKWHVAEKEAQLKVLTNSNGEWFNWIMLNLYKLSSGFGENAWKALTILIFLLVLPVFWSWMDIHINFFGWTGHSARASNIFHQWLKYIPLIVARDKSSDALSLLTFLWQLLITLQAALFAFALRNNFRR